MKPNSHNMNRKIIVVFLTLYINPSRCEYFFPKHLKITALVPASQAHAASGFGQKGDITKNTVGPDQ